jgi:hypothetical protein
VGVIALEISSRNARVAALQKRWDPLRAGLDLILDQRGADMADVPDGASGLLARGHKGKECSRWWPNCAGTSAMRNAVTTDFGGELAITGDRNQKGRVPLINLLGDSVGMGLRPG